MSDGTPGDWHESDDVFYNHAYSRYSTHGTVTSGYVRSHSRTGRQ